MSVFQKKWITRNFPFGYYNSFVKSSNHAIRWRKNQKRKSSYWFAKSYDKTKLRFYAFMASRPYAASSASRLNGKHLMAIRSTKPFCQFTLMTRSLVPHIKINKHAFKELSRDGFMVSIKRP